MKFKKPLSLLLAAVLLCAFAVPLLETPALAAPAVQTQSVEKRGTGSGRHRVFALKMEEICDTRRLMPSIHCDMRRLRKPLRYCIIPRRAVCPVPASPFRSLPSSSLAFSLIIPKSSPFSELFDRMKKHRTLSGVFSPRFRASCAYRRKRGRCLCACTGKAAPVRFLQR